MGTNHHTTGIGYKLKQRFKPLERLTPKHIILDAIKDKLKNTGIERLILVFNVTTDTYNVMVKNSNNTSLNLNIEPNEISMIKKIFVNRIQRKFEETSNKEIKAIIIQIDLELDTEDAISIFIEDLKSKVEKFIY